MTQVVFPKLPLSQVKEFRFQTCDYNWVLFPNIPLQPGPHRTKTIPSNLPAVKVDATSRPSANTVVERTINADAIGHDCLIDFDNGELLSPPHPDGRKITDVFKEKGIDAACTTEQFGPGLYGFDMVVSPVDSEAWDAWDKEPFRTLVHHVQNGKPGTPAVMSAAGQLPVTYMFKTREGGVGIVQILELRNEAVARFIRIRYRMLTAPIGSAAGATTAPPGSALSQPPHPNPR